ncbi:hypothetical protein GUITHDRAFT_154673 [Guillardia theta CCMP2712]|uniref:Uncharacterized protein n=1 Tax=Guillardia theta (strain CCMP2712) TaxID=905079 RepID=L1IQG8_GUITC|nr:hypothetical protein GUITHDRAFT_154673 [Guillardia theta CCMP2712]EKX38498.1 hypothetical protein GUITHDRAFT_154673 [Guillardia theta CCMP2712]|eukprot:XP_005825478.1 hypothetical protein GUITHDRAFT_154673 [Guillardia theta CCMP2712]
MGVFQILEATKTSSTSQPKKGAATSSSASTLSAMTQMGQFNGKSPKDEAIQSIENWFSSELKSFMGGAPKK